MDVFIEFKTNEKPPIARGFWCYRCHYSDFDLKDIQEDPHYRYPT